MTDKPKPKPNINSILIDSARKMHQLSTSSRFPKPPSNTTTTSNEEFKNKNKIIVPAITHKGDCNNPLCESCGTIITPSPQSSLPIIDKPSLSIGKFDIITQREPILNSKEIEKWENNLQFPVPEMIFGNNKIEIFKRKENNNNEINFKFSFNAFDALKKVDNYLTIDTKKMLKVSYAKEWYKSRKELKKNDDLQLSNENILEMYKPFDWTYTTNFKGNCNLNFIKSDKYLIPIDKLSRPDPILLYDDMILYEDELGDNGISVLSVKIRVMPNCLLILQRLFLRIDQVLIRNYETRLFIEFDKNLVIREFKKQELNYKDLLKKLPNQLVDPNKYLRDINYLVKILPIIEKTNEYLIIPEN